MKKITFLAIAFALVSIISCKKDRTCTCTNSWATTAHGFVAQPAHPADVTTMTHVSEDAAEIRCSAGTYTLTSAANDTDYTVSPHVYYAYTTTTTNICTLK